MTPPALTQLLQPVIRRYRAWQMWRGLALCWAVMALAALALIGAQQNGGWAPDWAGKVLLGVTLVSALIVWRVCRRFAPDLRWLARQVEMEHPELDSLLLAAVEQQPDENGRYSYLQQRVIREAIQHAARSRWAERFSGVRCRVAQVAHWCSLGVMLSLFVIYLTPAAKSLGLEMASTKAPAVVEVESTKITVEPGNAEIERGSGLVVLARFEGRVPTEVSLLKNPDVAGGETIGMVKSMQDPVFGATLTAVDQPFRYAVRYGEGRSEEYQVTVYEHPRLEKSNVEIRFPSYTGLKDQKIENSRRVTAVERSLISLDLQLNKPVVRAALVSSTETIELETDGRKASAALVDFELLRKNQYQLVLRDADGRTNKLSSRFHFVALENRPPELKFLSPKGDPKVSALEEIRFEVQAYDDFGLERVGLSYRLAGKEGVDVLLATNLPPRKKLNFSHLLALENLGVQPDNLITYHLWAEDTGPDAKLRRRESDIYFASVRPFEETWSEVENEGGEPKPPGPQGPSAKLADLLKEITFAGWKLRRTDYRDEPPPAPAPPTSPVAAP
ncbi:MAG: hypothetical protein ISQ14_08750 [Verrucomicrobiae bacterium]|nr:hypothetical protein [Verrucomicrobiae bacterium]